MRSIVVSVPISCCVFTQKGLAWSTSVPTRHLVAAWRMWMPIRCSLSTRSWSVCCYFLSFIRVQPFIFGGELIVTAALHFAYNRFVGRSTDKLLWPYSRSALAIFLFSFQQVTNTVLQYLYCPDLGNGYRAVASVQAIEWYALLLFAGHHSFVIEQLHAQILPLPRCCRHSACF